MALDLTAIVLTYNEEIDLPACLDSLSRLECPVAVVDSGSDDRTVDIAEQAGAAVFHHEFESCARQLNWALDNVPIDSEWLLRLDADERITPELADELTERLARPADGVTGFYVKRRSTSWAAGFATAATTRRGCSASGRGAPPGPRTG